MKNENEFGLGNITNEDLSIYDIPTEDSSLTEIYELALSFDGYDFYKDKSGDKANKHLTEYKKTGKLPTSLSELRNCLFFEQRRYHHFGRDPDENSMIYINNLINAIREKVKEKP